jgi:hypothetical protein
MISHDWPLGVCNYNPNNTSLFKRKPFLKNEILSNTLGSLAGQKLLNHLKPSYWFSSHLHCKYSINCRLDEKHCTQFIALDKCVPNRDYLQIVTLAARDDSKQGLAYDPEWLAIIKQVNSSNHYLALNQFNRNLNHSLYTIHTPTQDEINEIKLILKNDLTIAAYNEQNNNHPESSSFSAASILSSPSAQYFSDKSHQYNFKNFIHSQSDCSNSDEINVSELLL